MSSTTDLDRPAEPDIKAWLRERDADFPGSSGLAWPWTLVTVAYDYVLDLPAEHLCAIRLHTDSIDGISGSINISATRDSTASRKPGIPDTSGSARVCHPSSGRASPTFRARKKSSWVATSAD
jgi:hypothetical protein